MFSGGTPQKRFIGMFTKWMPIFRAFLLAVDRKSGGLSIDPFDFPMAPTKTMEVYRIMHELFLEKIVEANKPKGR